MSEHRPRPESVHGHPVEPFDLGMRADLPRFMGRRRALHVMSAAGLAGLGTLAACGSDDATSGSATTSGVTATTGASATTTSGGSASTTVAASAVVATEPIPEETAGPYPGDGSNGPDVLSMDGVVRRDITTSIGSASGVAGGVPLTIALNLQDLSNGGSALAGAAVYVWHCDREGRYSMYSQGVTDENYLRGVQPSDDSGTVTFTSVFPACYSGRWPHIHFEVYPSVADATSASNLLATSQIALPQDICTQVYATDGYEQSVRNLAQVSLAWDNVFGDDGGARELGTMSGGLDALTVSLAVPVNT